MPSPNVPGPLVELARNPVTAVSFPILLGVSSGLITRTSVNGWYKHIKKPPMEPPRASFPIAWTYLYGTMGYASYLLAGKLPLSAAKTALVLYYSQLGLNMLWTPLFFGAKQPLAALIDIVTLTGTVFNLTYVSRKVDTKAFYLFLPYCAWLSFATYLNGGVWWLNFGQNYFKRDAKGKGKADL